MARSIKKGVFYPLCFFKKFLNNPVIYESFCRAPKVPYEFTDRLVFVYNGHNFSKVSLQALTLGQRFGEFAPTRAIYKPKIKKNKKKPKKTKKTKK